MASLSGEMLPIEQIFSCSELKFLKLKETKLASISI